MNSGMCPYCKSIYTDGGGHKSDLCTFCHVPLVKYDKVRKIHASMDGIEFKHRKAYLDYIDNKLAEPK